MAGDERAWELARVAAGLAAGAGLELPESLALWSLAGGRPSSPAIAAVDPAGALGDALERSLDDVERRSGAHYTPDDVADRVVAMALTDRGRTVVDPACGGGALLLAAARHLVAGGHAPEVAARDLLWGADVDPLAAAVTEAAIALWSGGVAPAPGHVAAGDTLHDGRTVWSEPPREGFDVVVGNPPFQGQLAKSTVRSTRDTTRLRARFGRAVTPYTDTAALFLLVAVDLAAPGGRVALIQPQSTVASRDAGGVRATVGERARLVDLWAPREHLFAAKVNVCVAVLEVGRGDGGQDWTGHLATARGVPDLDLTGTATISDLADVAAGFRDEYYGLVPHVREASDVSAAPLVTSGLIDVGASAWGTRTVRFAKQRWKRPEIDLRSLRAADPRVAAWVDRVRRPKVVVASQTQVIEAAADVDGTWVPSTPVVSVLPHDSADVHHLAALLCSPPVSAWAARRAAGTALSADAMRVSTRLVADVPMPPDRCTWDEASGLLRAGDLLGYAEAATAMFDLAADQHRAALAWWGSRMKPTWPPVELVR